MEQYNPGLYHKYFAQLEKVYYHGVGVAIQAGLQQRATKQEKVAQIPQTIIAPQLQQHPPIITAYQQRQQQYGSLVATAEQRQTFTTRTGLHVQKQQQGSSQPTPPPTGSDKTKKLQ